MTKKIYFLEELVNDYKKKIKDSALNFQMKANIQVNHFDLGQIKPKITDKIKAQQNEINQIIKIFKAKYEPNKNLLKSELQSMNKQKQNIIDNNNNNENKNNNNEKNEKNLKERKLKEEEEKAIKEESKLENYEEYLLKCNICGFTTWRWRVWITDDWMYCEYRFKNGEYYENDGRRNYVRKIKIKIIINRE